MIALLQRVSEASVTVAGQRCADIGAGLLALVCAEQGDDEHAAQALCDKMLTLRMFSDTQGRMNDSLLDTQGALLAVPQFTLAADLSRGKRPSFTPAAAPERARLLFNQFVAAAKAQVSRVETGVFGADMKVALVNDGPVTFWLRIAPAGAPA